MLRSLLLTGCLLPIMALGQTSPDALGGASDAAQRVFDGRHASPMPLDTNRVFDPSEVMKQPAYPGSEAALLEQLTSAQGCPVTGRIEACSSTRVTVSFIVERNGGISGAMVEGEGCAVLEEKTLCGLKGMARWAPGELRDVPVRVRMRIPVQYELR